ncbi:MAG: lipopolysaccharide biosynthesis protein [Phycisphaerales bacterium]|nr:lipopolysaccharide biosynthesis protein [Planctomycetota bacterium]
MADRDPLAADDLHRDLPRRSVRGGAVVLVGQGGNMAIGLLSAAVLARILDPTDFGIIAMASAFIVLLGEFADAGLSQATIQRHEINASQVSTLFWVNVAVGAVATLIGVGLAWPIALFYGDPRLVMVTIALSAGFLLSGVAAQPLALVRRRMRFATEASVQLGSLGVGLAAGIVAAFEGLGYWALVIQTLTTSLVQTLGIWIASGWIPGRPVRGSGVREMLRFGGFLSGTNIVAAFIRMSDRVLVGRFVGPDAAGLYDNAKRLVVVPVTQLNKPLTMVSRSVLARLQHDAERFRAYYRQGIETIASASLPVTMWFLISAEETVLTVLGPQWTASVPIFQALAPAAMLASLGVVTSWIYVPLGRTDRLFRWQCLQAVVTVAALAIGLRWGAIGVAVAFSTSLFLLRVPAIAYCLHGTFVRWSDVLGSVWRPVVAVAVAGAAAAVVAERLPLPEIPIVGLVARGGLLGIAYVIVWVLLPGGVRRGREILGAARHLLPGSGGAGGASDDREPERRATP